MSANVLRLVTAMKRPGRFVFGGAASLAVGVLIQQLYKWFTRNQYNRLPVILLRNNENITVQISLVGASIQRLYVPDRNGGLLDVVLGFEHQSTYAVCARFV